MNFFLNKAQKGGSKKSLNLTDNDKYQNKTKQNKIYCHNPNENTTQPQHRSWVGHENDFAHPTLLNSPTTTETQL